MKHPFHGFAGQPDLQAITATIQRALSSAGLLSNDTTPAADDQVIDVPSRVVSDHAAPATPAAVFEQHLFRNAAGSRAYKLYRPARASASGKPPMLLVMLHGCTQSADDFALGTGMNRLADEHGFLVLYPEQSAQANSSRCWNWFQPGDQRHGAGEPSLIAGCVRDVAARHGVDPRGIFVAGLSAGAAMALVMGETYPELFAAVGVHSGLAYGSAHDVASALAAMKGGRGAAAGPARPTARTQQALPLIVFHGDRDHTVQASNASAIVAQASEAYQGRPGAAPLRASSHSAQAPQGRRFTRTSYAPEGGPVHIESWLLHGAGHHWSGGDARGSYTDARGPDASAEMFRFFQAVAARG